MTTLKTVFQQTITTGSPLVCSQVIFLLHHCDVIDHVPVTFSDSLFNDKSIDRDGGCGEKELSPSHSLSLSFSLTHSHSLSLSLSLFLSQQETEYLVTELIQLLFDVVEKVKLTFERLKSSQLLCR